MKSFKFILLVTLVVAFASCRDTNKEEQIIDAQIDSIEAVETELNKTVLEVEEKTIEVEDALKELDSI